MFTDNWGIEKGLVWFASRIRSNPVNNTGVMAATCSGDWGIWMSFDERQCQAISTNGRRYPPVANGGRQRTCYPPGILLGGLRRGPSADLGRVGRGHAELESFPLGTWLMPLTLAFAIHFTNHKQKISAGTRSWSVSHLERG
ncbi:hypothetical protein B0H14DRAFT_2574151 [Mycena olivaceomarginata]|nr:hypothetical protein B0H14DRAFT_2574151 [Mycena olivaceomarginata]